MNQWAWWTKNRGKFKMRRLLLSRFIATVRGKKL